MRALGEQRLSWQRFFHGLHARARATTPYSLCVHQFAMPPLRVTHPGPPLLEGSQNVGLRSRCSRTGSRLVEVIRPWLGRCHSARGGVTSDGTRPASHGTRPASHGTRPTSHGTRPASHGTRPTSHGTRPTSHGTRPTPRGTRPPARGTRPPRPRHPSGGPQIPCSSPKNPAARPEFREFCWFLAGPLLVTLNSVCNSKPSSESFEFASVRRTCGLHHEVAPG